jgi:tetratricopeptide (TPR) repeat protein
VVDQENVFGALYNLRAVPFGIYIDEAGRIVKPPHGISVSEDETLEELERWIDGEQIAFEAAPPSRDAEDPSLKEADLRFALGSHLLSQGRADEATAEWRQALELDPGNWIIHKQIWAVEHPEAFYDGSVDYGWQKEQLRREAEGEKG